MTAQTIFYKKRLFWVTCGIPSLLSCFYLFVIATPRYESTAIFRVYESGQDAQSGGAAAMGGMGGASASPGSYILTSYVKSWDAFQQLNPQKLQAHWSDADWLSHFGGPLSLYQTNKMKLWEYYRSHVVPKLDETTGLVTLTIDGYSADFVWKLNQRIIDLAQEELSQSGIKADRAERQMLLKKLESDKEQLASDLEHISELQKKSGFSDLKNEYQSVLTNLTAAQKERISISTRAAASAFLAQRGQQIETLKRQLAALDIEIASQRNDIARKSKIYKEYGRIENAIKQDSNVIMLDEQSLLENEQNSIRHAYYLDIIENPVNPTDPTHPLALMWTAIIFSLSFVLYLIIK